MIAVRPRKRLSFRRPSFARVMLYALLLAMVVVAALPLFVPEAADQTVAFQINAIVEAFEKFQKTSG